MKQENKHIELTKAEQAELSRIEKKEQKLEARSVRLAKQSTFEVSRIAVFQPTVDIDMFEPGMTFAGGLGGRAATAHHSPTTRLEFYKLLFPIEDVVTSNGVEKKIYYDRHLLGIAKLRPEWGYAQAINEDGLKVQRLTMETKSIPKQFAVKYISSYFPDEYLADNEDESLNEDPYSEESKVARRKKFKEKPIQFFVDRRDLETFEGRLFYKSLIGKVKELRKVVKRLNRGLSPYKPRLVTQEERENYRLEQEKKRKGWYKEKKKEMAAKHLERIRAIRTRMREENPDIGSPTCSICSILLDVKKPELVTVTENPDRLICTDCKIKLLRKMVLKVIENPEFGIGEEFSPLGDRIIPLDVTLQMPADFFRGIRENYFLSERTVFLELGWSNEKYRLVEETGVVLLTQLMELYDAFSSLGVKLPLSKQLLNLFGENYA